MFYFEKIKKINLNPIAVYLLFIALILTALASVLSSSYSMDSMQYKNYFSLIASGDYVNVEVSFYIVSFISGLLFKSVVPVFVFYALVSIFVKIFIINKYSPYPFLSIIVFCSYYFLVQESNMIRIGLASSFFMLACFSYFNKNYLSYFSLSLIAVFLHYSCFVVLFLPLIVSRSVRLGFYRSLFFLISCILLAIFSSALNFIHDILVLLSTYDPTGKLVHYINLAENGVFTNINLANRILPYLCFLIPLFFVYFKACNLNRYYSYYMQIVCFGLFVFSALSPLPVLAYRFSEVFLIFCILLFPFVTLLFEKKIFGFLYIFAYFLFSSLYIVVYLGYYDF